VPIEGLLREGGGEDGVGVPDSEFEVESAPLGGVGDLETAVLLIEHYFLCMFAIDHELNRLFIALPSLIKEICNCNFSCD
jgi:hypothetical protein